MITLNIAPRSLKLNNKYNEIIRQIKGIFYLVLGSLLLYIVVLAAFLFVAKGNLSQTASQSFYFTKTTEDFTNRTKEINEQLSHVEKIQADYIAWSGFFEFLSENYSKNISLSQVSINKTDNSVRISGEAAGREDLMSWQEKMEGSGYFEQVVLPFSSLVKENNIPFEISAKFINYEFSDN